ncbi:MAG: diguanylate cyclase [Bdellovibrionaceae bacterium]|nr:diguanylate cyclase [Pseudobdellovibrionaceae bacterium]MDW8190132.1 diguanylate cyclase [Pseudobdellovibrionaceae bacterium]
MSGFDSSDHNEHLKDKSILAIDDDEESIAIFSAILTRYHFKVHACSSLEEARKFIHQTEYDLVLLDVNLSGEKDGFRLLSEIKNHYKNFVSVIFVSGESETETIVRGLDAGADDYIVKPFSAAEFLARVRAQLRIKHLTDQLHKANSQLQELVEIDDLTQLYNMRSIYQKIDLEIDRARRYNRHVCVVMMDMDHFKKVNDGHDHLFGSFVLAEVGKIIRESIRTIDIGARYGGDEFLIMLTETHLEGALAFCERIRKKIESYHFEKNNDHVNLTASLGFAVVSPAQYPIDSQTLVREADHALYQAKRQGRNCIVFRELKDESSAHTKKVKNF